MTPKLSRDSNLAAFNPNSKYTVDISYFNSRCRSIMSLQLPMFDCMTSLTEHLFVIQSIFIEVLRNGSSEYREVPFAAAIKGKGNVPSRAFD